MAAGGSTLGRKQGDAIAALLTQRNVEEAARTAGVGARTLLRWLRVPEFDAAWFGGMGLLDRYQLGLCALRSPALARANAASAVPAPRLCL